MRLRSQATGRRLLLAVAVVAVAVYGTVRGGSSIFEGGHGPGETQPAAMISGPVVRVADGDTLTIRLRGGREERVRILGINTPEVHGPVECGGPEASAAMKRLATGASVTVTPDPTQDRRDRFGRLLGYVELDGRDLGLEMIRSGLAIAYPFGRPFQRYPAYREAENAARQAKTGSWARCRLSRR